MKPWYQSKTIWLGGLAVATSVVSALQAGLDWKGAALAGFGAASIFLRTLTDSPLGKEEKTNAKF